MKNWWLAFFLATSFTAKSQTNLHLTNWTFTNLQGRVYSNTTLLNATLTNISVNWEPYGYARIDFTNLPDEVRQMFSSELAALKAKDEATRKANAEAAAHRYLLAAASTETNFHQICESFFPQWDSNHDGFLNLAEVNALVENPQVRGPEAVALVTIRSHLKALNEQIQTHGMSREQVLEFAGEPGPQTDYVSTLHHLATVNRTLFLPGDPNLLTINQGALGDCYLLAVIGALVNRDPQAVRNMIKPQPDGGFSVYFPTGKIISVPSPTDADVVMLPGMGSDHGIWLCVLDKAYAKIRQDNRDELTGETATPANSVPVDWLRGGRAPPTIQQWTGHKTIHILLQREFHDDTQKGVQTLDPLLVKLTAERRLIAVGGGDASKTMPAGIPHGHVFALLSYDHPHQIVRLFNPWGNTVTPTGPPGLVNGYLTRHGIFNIPLRDFVQIFHALSYETEEPL